MGDQIGKVVHFYPKISVAIIELTGSLKVGDKIVIGEGDDAFEHTVSSMEYEHKKLEEAKAGDSVGIKVDQRPTGHAKVFRTD